MKSISIYGLLKTTGILLTAAMIFGFAPGSMASTGSQATGDLNATVNTAKEASTQAQAPGKDFGDAALHGTSLIETPSTTAAGSFPGYAAQLRQAWNKNGQ